MLSDLSRLYLGVHISQRLCILCRNNDTARVSVDTVAQRRGEGLLLVGIVLSLAVKIRLDMHYEGVLSPLVVLMDKHSGALIEKHYIIVLIENIELGSYTAQRSVVLFGIIEKLVSYKELYLVTLAKYIFLLRSLTVDLYLLRPDALIHHRRWQALDCLGEKLVKPLPRVILAYDQYLHKILQ